MRLLRRKRTGSTEQERKEGWVQWLRQELGGKQPGQVAESARGWQKLKLKLSGCQSRDAFRLGVWLITWVCLPMASTSREELTTRLIHASGDMLSISSYIDRSKVESESRKGELKRHSYLPASCGIAPVCLGNSLFHYPLCIQSTPLKDSTLPQDYH